MTPRWLTGLVPTQFSRPVRWASVPLVALLFPPNPAKAEQPTRLDRNDSVARLGGYEWHRVTSTDPTGGNTDYVSIPAGKSVTLAEIEGPGEIAHIWMTYFEPPGAEGALRELSLSITWDGAEGPSVLTPLGDFFGMGNGRKYMHENAYTAVIPKLSLNAYFPMPFRKDAKIEIVNDSASDIPALYYYVEFKKFDSPDEVEGLGYFHAQYRQSYPASSGEAYRVLEANGRGAYLGTLLSVVLNTNGWWGEGDDLIMIDGELRKGTGTEDYFCGSWNFGSQSSQTMRFGAPLADGLESAGAYWAAYRFHPESPIQFSKSITFDFEHGFRENDGRPVSSNNYSSIAYYYLETPAAQAPLPPGPSRLPHALLPPEPNIIEGVEAENLYVRKEGFAVSGGLTALERMDPKNRAWSGNTHWQLTAFAPGGRFAAVIPVPVKLVYSPSMTFTKSPHFANYDVYLNGNLLKKDVSTWSNETGRETVTFPNMLLDPGMAILEFVARTFPGPEGNPVLNLGVDSIRFAPATGGEFTDARPQPPTGAGAVVHAFTIDDKIVADKENDFSLEGFALSDNGPGRAARSLDFTGGGVIRANSPAADKLGNTFEISFWVHPAQVQSRQTIFERRDACSVWIEDGAVHTLLRDADGGFARSASPAKLIMPNAWTHVRVSVEPTRIRTFVQGALVREDVMPYLTRLNALGAATTLGATAEGAYPFGGLLSEIRVTSGAVTPAAGEGN